MTRTGHLIGHLYEVPFDSRQIGHNSEFAIGHVVRHSNMSGRRKQ